ncbi:Uncharacterised protein [Chlamydia abortus]|nr:Uncharacterised protein [Chlamydia abortus]
MGQARIKPTCRIRVGNDVAKTSKSALKICLFPKRRRKTLKCAGLLDEMGPFRKNRSKDLHYRYRIRHVATFTQKDLHYRFRITHHAAFPKKTCIIALE